jgi:hypothetical protein
MRLSSILLAAAFVALTACTSSVKTSDDGKSTTVQTDQGTVTTGKAVDTSKLGVPNYPNASSDDAASVSGTSGGTTGAIVAFKTSDDFDKVYAFYKSKLPAGAEKMKTTTPDGSVAMFSIEDKAKNTVTNVQIVSKAGETTILITHQGS